MRTGRAAPRPSLPAVLSAKSAKGRGDPSRTICALYDTTWPAKAARMAKPDVHENLDATARAENPQWSLAAKSHFS